MESQEAFDILPILVKSLGGFANDVVKELEKGGVLEFVCILV
jgi:hypothetical protein